MSLTTFAVIFLLVLPKKSRCFSSWSYNDKSNIVVYTQRMDLLIPLMEIFVQCRNLKLQGTWMVIPLPVETAPKPARYLQLEMTIYVKLEMFTGVRIHILFPTLYIVVGGYQGFGRIYSLNLPRRRRQYVPPNLWYLTTRLHGVMREHHITNNNYI
jgi:hypothetical protein